jgi:hypothetical protein
MFTKLHNSTYTCLNEKQRFYSHLLKTNKINKQTNLSSSHFLSKKKSLQISRHVGESANPASLLQCGGPGDLWTSRQNITSKVTYRLPITKTRTQNKHHYGVEKKNGSYDRYLSRKVGGILRKEVMPNVIANRNSLSTEYNNCFSNKKCCDNRIPNNCKSCTEPNTLCNGCFGNNTQGVAQTTCNRKCIINN